MFTKTISTLCLGSLLALSTVDGTQAQTAPPPRTDDEKTLTDVQWLGKRIFEDATLSEPQGMSCMSCHQPDHAFQGNNGSPIAAIALGSRPGQLGTRKTPTLMYKTYSPAFGFYKDVDDGKETLEAKGGQFWDGRASDLKEQAAGPLLNPVEMNNPSIEAVVEKVKTGYYADAVKAIYGADVFADPKVAFARLTDAIFAFESSERFAPFASKFDDYLRGTAKLTREEARGLALFLDPKKGNCAACHAGKPESKDPTDWIFTDFTYDALGAPRNRAIPANADPAVFDLGLCKRPGLAEIAPKEIKIEALCGAFKVPTLRNIAVTAPYYHNGAISSLREAVTFYATRDTDPAHWYSRDAHGNVIKFDDLPATAKENVNIKEVPYDRKVGQPARLNYREIDDLVAFLKTLTDKGMK